IGDDECGSPQGLGRRYGADQVAGTPRRVRRRTESLRPREVPGALAGSPGRAVRAGGVVSRPGARMRARPGPIGEKMPLHNGIGRALALASPGVEEYNLQ